MKPSIHPAVAIVALALALPPVIWSQCPGNDGLSFGPACCLPASTTVPTFPTMTLNGLGACIRDCAVENQLNTTTVLSPTQILCDYWIFGVTITSAAPAPPLTVSTPLLVAKYARTWMELPAVGTVPIQVWRFLVNGDFVYSPTTTTAAGCPVPLSAAPPFSLPVHFIGHIDYAFNCATGGWEVAYSLSHFCPTEMHAPFSQRPIPAAGGWPKRTYHFVGPSNFVFGICPPPSGAIIAESTRTSLGLTTPVPYTCLHETQVVSGQLNDAFSNCVCFDPAPVPPPARYTHQSLIATEVCAGVAAPILSFGGLGLAFLPTGMRAYSIGSWVPAAAAGTYPGAECVSVYLAVLESPGICGPFPPPFGTLHAATGVGTTGGFLASLLDSPLPAFLPLEFLDLENILVLTAAGFVPGIGSLFGSERVWSFNMM